MTRRALGVLVALSVPAAGALNGCGTAGLDAAQVRARATQVCSAATQRLDTIPAPQTPRAGAAFLRAGVAGLAPEVRGLRALGGRGQLATAVTATAGELAALRSSLAGLQAGNDPTLGVKTLQAQLQPLEARADAAWRALRIPACVGR